MSFMIGLMFYTKIIQRSADWLRLDVSIVKTKF